MTTKQINKFKQDVADVLKCSVDEIEVGIFPFKGSQVEEVYPEYHKTKDEQIRAYLRDCDDVRNLTFFEPFIRYYEESDEFIEVANLDIIEKYMRLNNIGKILDSTGVYIYKNPQNVEDIQKRQKEFK